MCIRDSYNGFQIPADVTADIYALSRNTPPTAMSFATDFKAIEDPLKRNQSYLSLIHI